MKAVVLICLCLVAMAIATEQQYEDCINSMDCLEYPASQARKSYCCNAGHHPRMNWHPFYCECVPDQ